MGLAAGTLATTVGVNGPPMVMYLLRTGADQHQIRDTMSATFLLYTPLVIAALILGGRLGLGDVGPAELAGLLALVLVGPPPGPGPVPAPGRRDVQGPGACLGAGRGAASVVAGLAG